MYERHLHVRSGKTRRVYNRKDREVKRKVKELKRKTVERRGEQLSENY